MVFDFDLRVHRCSGIVRGTGGSQRHAVPTIDIQGLWQDVMFDGGGERLLHHKAEENDRDDNDW